MQVKNTLFHIQNGIENADDWFARLQNELKWEEIVWGPTNRKLPRLCSNRVERTKIGQEITQWLIKFLYMNFGITTVGVAGIFGNNYRNGDDYLPMHKDQYGNLHVISLSFGAKRRFKFWNATDGNEISYDLEHGDIIFFGNEMHTKYKHGISKEKNVKTQRINLTFFVQYHDKTPY